MPPPFRQLTLGEFADLLARFPFERRITAVHMHHTWKPRARDYKGLRTIEGMWRVHTKENGWDDIAQHITVAPDGAVWTGRGWNEPPVSAVGHNGDRRAGPFMFELIGDFDVGREPFATPQRDAALEVIARVQMKFGLGADSLRFHNQMSGKTCPGSSVSYRETLAAVREVRARLEREGARGAARPESPFPAEARSYREKTDSVIELLTGPGSQTNDPPDAEPPEEDAGAGRGREGLASEAGDWERIGSEGGASGAGWHEDGGGAAELSGNWDEIGGSPTSSSSGNWDEVAGSPESSGGWDSLPGDAPPPAGWPGVREGRRRALCVGIDTYPTAPLGGCVADARAWRDELRGLGFETSLLLDERATRDAILAELSGLIGASAPGDVIVFQYAGHGTTVPDASGDEVEGNNREDEALCPHDFADGRLIVDDDVAEIFRGLPEGVNLTCFFDCCHSGSISRFGVGVSPENASRGGGARPRFVTLTGEQRRAHTEYRAQAGRRSVAGSRGPDAMKQVVFAACLDSEVAWEENGQGDFTRQATPLLSGAAGGATNEEFARLVTHAFGSAPRQHPELDCAPRARTRAFLQPLAAGKPAASPSPLAGAAASGGWGAERGEVAAALRELASRLEARR